MSFHDLELEDLGGICRLTRVTAGITGLYRCEVVFDGVRAIHYSGYVWMPACLLSRIVEEHMRSGGHYILPNDPYSIASFNISRPAHVDAQANKYVRVLSIFWAGNALGGEASIAQSRAKDITTKLDEALINSSQHVVMSDDSSICVGIRSTIQAQRRKSDGSYVAVYSAWYRGQEAILKVNFKLSDESKVSDRVDTELKALRIFQKYGCEHAPSLLANFKKDLGGAIAKYEHCVVMTKVPGVNLWDESLSEQDKTDARQALPKAIREVHRCGVDNMDHHAGNVIYDAAAKKCYIIDFEQAEFHESPLSWTDDTSGWDIWHGTGSSVSVLSS